LWLRNLALWRQAYDQDVQDLAIMRTMPDMTVLAPADAIEGEAIIRWATEYDGPVFVRWRAMRARTFLTSSTASCLGRQSHSKTEGRYC